MVGEGAVFRKGFCKELMKYKMVDFPGNVLHNVEAIEEMVEKLIRIDLVVEVQSC